MFNRVLVFTSLLTAGLVGCSLNAHHGCGCCEHGVVRNVSRSFGEFNACTCTPPLFPGDQGCYVNCRQHGRQRPLKQLATKVRRSAPSVFGGAYSNNCDSVFCGTGSCEISQFGCNSYDSGQGMCQQTVCSQPVWTPEGDCGCDSCSSGVPSTWQIVSTYNSGVYPSTTGSTGCSCGEQTEPYATSYPVGGGLEYYTPDNSPPMDGHGNPYRNPSQSVNGQRFAPSGPQVLPVPPETRSKPAPMPPNDTDAVPMPMPMPMPMPQDMTPMDSDSLSPKDSLFDPLSEDGAPAAESPVEPISYEIPLLPPLPVPDHQSSEKRVALPYTQ